MAVTHPKVSRRDFLKLLSLTALPLLRAPLRRFDGLQGQQKNILVLVYDAWTSKNIGMFGYPRETMPHLTALSEKAIVYHNHHATSDFTTPGTASLLTGTLPWTHRAIHVAGHIRDGREGHNLFNLFDDYYSMAYSHNVLVNVLLEQMIGSQGLDDFVPFHEMMLYSDWGERVFSKDRDLSSVASFYIFDQENPLTNSLFLNDILRKLNEYSLERLRAEYAQQFPLGLPRSTRNTHYILEGAREWLSENLPGIGQPFLGYFHFLPPHDPYRTRSDFVGRFDDGWEAPEKPEHPFNEGTPPGRVAVLRRQYDEFMAYVDDEFAKLYGELDAQGLLENTILVLTSDHGETFERRLIKHGTNTFYEPIIRVPLMIFDPDQTQRLDVHAPTSAIDILPTLAHMSGKAVPDWAEGQVLAPYGEEDARRSVFAVTAKENGTGQPLNKGTLAILRDGYKLVEYAGYDEFDGQTRHELFNVRADPEELDDLIDSQPGMADELKAELDVEKKKADEALR